MNYVTYILLLLICMPLSGFAKDKVILKNGDIMTGTVIDQSRDYVYFKSDAFVTVRLNAADVEKIQFEVKELGQVEIPSDAIAPGQKSDLPPKPATKTVATTPQKTKPATKTTKPPRKRKTQWSGQTGLAIALREKTRSNHSGIVREEQYETYRFYGNINWSGNRNNLRWNWNYRYGRDKNKVVNYIRDDYLNITQRYKHSFKNDNLFLESKTMYQRDYNRRIENEYLQTAELGIKWFPSDAKIQLSTAAGGGYHKYDRLDTSRTETTSIGQPKFIFDESLRWKLINSLTLTQKYTHLGDLTNYHFLFAAGLENKIIQELFLRIEYRLDRDTEVFYDDRGYYDKALLTSILYKF